MVDKTLTLFDMGGGEGLDEDGYARASSSKPTDPFSGVRGVPASLPETHRSDVETITDFDPPASHHGTPSGSRGGRRASAPPPTEVEPVGAPVGFHEGRDGRVRPGIPVGWPWRPFGAAEAQRAPEGVRKAIAAELRRAPAIREGGRVVFASSRASALVVTPEEVAQFGPDGRRTLPVTVERGGQVFRLVKLGVWAWLAAGLTAVFRGSAQGRIDAAGFRSAVFGVARLRVELERAEAFLPGDLDWAEQHAFAPEVREYAIVRS